MNTSDIEFFDFRRIGPITPAVQIFLIAALYVCTTLVGYAEFKSVGTLFGYPPHISILFVPIYEELIFRGLILGLLLQHRSVRIAIIVTSVLFSLWHLKNLFFLAPDRVVSQMAYAGLVFSPIACLLTLRTRSVWPSVILHYAHNLLAPLSSLLLVVFRT